MRTTYFSSQNKKAATFSHDATSGNRETMRAWEFFVEHGHLNQEVKNTVRSNILESWARCTSSGVGALSKATPQKVCDEDVHFIRRRNKSLCEAAKLAFDGLAPHLSGTGAILILTDQTGTVIEAIGDNRTLDAGREIQLEVGGVWDESVIGTNGIGTALSTGMPTYVHASEHFCQGIKSWTCVGVPIIDALDRSVIGLIDLSGPSNIYRPHNIALVVATAREIELNLAQQQREEHTALLEEFIDQNKRHDSDSVIILLNNSGKIVYSRNTEFMNLNGYGKLTTGKKFLDLYPDMSVCELEAALPPALLPKGVDLIRSGGKTLGVALLLNDRAASISLPRPTGISIKPRSGIIEEEVKIVGDSPGMQEAIEFARRAAEMKIPVLINGETGVGKELFARLIHSYLPSTSTPYIVVNCATISPDQIRKELFGQTADSTRGVSCEDRLGKFEQANGGVLCFDEIGDMPLDLQTYLLRTLEQRTIYRVGCDIRRPIDVLPISMTSRNIRDDINSGRFRQDLFYRIGTVVIDIPPLRQRGQDIDLLIDYFNNKLAIKYGRKLLLFNSDAMDALKAYRWPGNVRELRNVVERLCLLKSSHIIALSDLPREIINPAANSASFMDAPSLPAANPMDLDEIESIAIQRSIDLENGNLTKAATSLGISRPTLYRKIRQYGLVRNK